MRAGGEQAEVEGHEGMAHDAEVGGVQGLMGRSAGHALLGGVNVINILGESLTKA